jgi:tetratricopeptide (TPR) repeat protein
MRRILLRLDDSIAAYEKAIELDPNSAEIWLELAASLSASYTRFDECGAALQRASEIGWDDFDLVNAVARRHLLDGQYEEAERHFRRAAGLSERQSISPSFHYDRARALGALGRGADAHSELELALEMGMRVFETDLTLMELEKVAGMLVFELAAFCVPILLALGRRDEAIKTAQRVADQGQPSTYSFPESIYLAEPLKRIEYFESVIAGRDVVILAHGPSIRSLEERIGELAGQDICYASLNQFPQVEERILSKIGEHLDLVMVGNPQSFEDHEEKIHEFLSRDEDNIFAGSHYATTFIQIDRFSDKAFKETFDSKLIYFDCQHYYPPTLIRPLHFAAGNTLSVLIPFLLLGKPRRIFFFGADGGGDPASNDGAYFFSESPDGETDRKRVAETFRRLRLDARDFDQNIEAAMILVSAMYRVPIPEIFNVCLDSAHQTFPMISCDDALEMLKT